MKIVKLTFARGASWRIPRSFSTQASLEALAGPSDIGEGEELEVPRRSEALVKAAVVENGLEGEEMK